MNPKAMEPLGRAMRAFLDGDTRAELIIRRDDNQQSSIPVGYFFRDQEELTAIDIAALQRCRGNVLDIGAGSGLHSLALQKAGVPVTAIDVSPLAVEVMFRRGVREAHSRDIFDFDGGPFDTLLMMGHGIGVVETIAGLDRFLAHARKLLARDGQVLLDSVDVGATDDPVHLAYHEANRKAGRYIGEVRMQLEFRGEKGSPAGWLQLDFDTLRERAGASGWRSDSIVKENSGEYLAKLST